MYLLGDRAGILPVNNNNACWLKDDDGNPIIRYTDCLEATVETLDRMLQNSLSEHNLKYCQAKPIKLQEGNKVCFYTDETYKVSEYKITYLKRPQTYNLLDPYSEYPDLTDEVMHECIKLAAKSFIENKQLQRYNTISNEINEME